MENSIVSKHLLQLLLGDPATEVIAISPRLRLWAEAEEVQRFLGRAVLRETRVYAGLLGRMLARRGRGSLRSRRCPNFPSKGPYTRRLPGAQPGNLNSSTHGYYAGRLPEDFEDLDPEEAKIMGIENEIVALRMMLNRTFGMARDVDNLALMIRITGLVGSVTTRISKLLLARQALRGGRMKAESADRRRTKAEELIRAFEGADLPE